MDEYRKPEDGLYLELQSVASGIDNSVRKREFSQKGMQYEKEKLTELFIKLKKQPEKIIELMRGNSTYDQIITKYSFYMDKYEQYIERHQNFMARVSEDEKEAYVDILEDRDKFLDNFKRSIEGYFKLRGKSRTSSHTSSRSSSSKHSSYASRISFKKLAEEQHKVELEYKREALEKKKRLELAKLQLQIEEEELELSTEIAVSKAKTKVLEKYEQLESSLSESSDNVSRQRSVLADSLKNEVLNPEAKAFRPFQLDVPTKDEQGAVQSDIDTVANMDRIYQPIQKTYVVPKQTCQNNFQNIHDQETQGISREPLYSNTNAETMQAIVRNLRKPIPDIKKFGDPLQFRKFVRQFYAKVVQNCETEDEKMNYLEQFTYGEANKLITGFSHIVGDFAFTGAMQQLEERYGSPDIIASAFIKKALDWPDIKSNDAKGLDEFALFLVECENAAYSINSLKILEYANNIKRLMCKLPFHLHDRWRNVVLRMKTNKQSIEFSHFVEYVQGEAKKVNDFTYGTRALNTKIRDESHNSKDQGQKRNLRTNSALNLATDIEQTKANTVPSKVECPYCKTNSHKLEHCTGIIQLDHKQRYEHLMSQALCFGCLKRGHMTKSCRNRLTCYICHRKHPSILRDDKKIKKIESDGENKLPEIEACSASEVVSTLGAGNNPSCAMTIVPVKVKTKNKDKILETYAFFNTGSSASFCTEENMRELGGRGKCIELSLHTMGNPFKLRTYALNGLQVCDMDMNSIMFTPRKNFRFYHHIFQQMKKYFSGLISMAFQFLISMVKLEL